jgi:hypothetical protein
MATARSNYATDLSRAWIGTLRRLTRLANTTESGAWRAHGGDLPTGRRGTLLELAEAVFGKRGIRYIPRRMSVGTPAALGPSEESLEELARFSGEACPVCSLVSRDLAISLMMPGKTFPERLMALVSADDLCNVHAWLALDIAGGDVEARRHPLTRSVVDSLAIERREASSSLTCHGCAVQSRREREYCLGLASIFRQRTAHAVRPSEAVVIPCLPHLILLLALAPPDVALEVIRAMLPVLHHLRHELTEYIRKQDYRFRNEPAGTEQTAPLRALELVAGARWVECGRGGRR